MTILTSQTAFTVAAPAEVETAAADLIILPDNPGSNAPRQLRYPDNTLPPLIYLEPPDKTQNFDTFPLTNLPALSVQGTLAGNVLNDWPGYLQDKPVAEIWQGSDSGGHCLPAYMLRRLLGFILNPPPDGSYLTWWPQDRTTQGYYIKIAALKAGDSLYTSPSNNQQLPDVTFDAMGMASGYLLGEVVLAFYILGEAP